MEDVSRTEVVKLGKDPCGSKEINAFLLLCSPPEVAEIMSASFCPSTIWKSVRSKLHILFEDNFHQN